jgi:opacity protein-like surface antigen
MHKLLVGITAAVTIAISAAPVLAQQQTGGRRRAATVRPVPAPGMWAIGGSIGASAPSDAALDNGIDLAGNIERYLTRRVSIRGQIGASWWDIQGHSFDGTIRPFFADANAVYNWEGGVIHPYVTAGVGMYHFHASEPTLRSGSDSDTKAGVNFGGGLEYFLDRRTTMGGELLYHKVGAFESPLASFGDGSFWRFGFGLKRYF